MANTVLQRKWRQIIVQLSWDLSSCYPDYPFLQVPLAKLEKANKDFAQTNNHQIVVYDKVLEQRFGKEGSQKRIKAEEDALFSYPEKVPNRRIVTPKIYQFAILTIRHPNAVCIFAMVCKVKLCRPVSHFDISDSRLLSICAKSFCVSPFVFRISQIRSAMLFESSNSAFCSAGIAAKQSWKSLFCIMSLNFKSCAFYAEETFKCSLIYYFGRADNLVLKSLLYVALSLNSNKNYSNSLSALPSKQIENIPTLSFCSMVLRDTLVISSVFPQR